MKKTFVLFLGFILANSVFAQNPSYQQRLYYTCKTWGFVKYFHSKVSVCEVKWDSVLISTLPLIKNSVTKEEFNDVLIKMLRAAGPMEIAATSWKDTLSPELKRNLNFGWMNEPIFRSDVQNILDTIKINFRPHPICWVKNNDGTGYGWLAFPNDDPIINKSLSINYPDENTRLSAIFRYWNLMNYFNPNRYILETPWDSTLYNNVLAFANASNYNDFFLTFRKMTSKLNDAHVEGMTASFPFLSGYIPKIILRYSQGKYIVVKSGYPQISKGDVITSINGKTTSEWEYSLSPYISAGNPSVLRRFMCYYMLRGDLGSPILMDYKDSLGNLKNLATYRYSTYNNAWFWDYYPNDTLSQVKWRWWNCNVAYVHMGNVFDSDMDSMYREIKNSKAIIFDIRNYPNGIISKLAELMFPDSICTVKFMLPDVKYPGTFLWSQTDLGIKNNPSSYKGKVIILCNQETQSHAEFTCMILKAMPNAVIVGSQTAGADGNITGFKLSQEISTGFTSLGAFYPDGKETQRIGIVPDSAVYISPEGIRHGRDEVLEKALKIAGCSSPSQISELKPENNSLFIYPNPTSGNISITYNLTGYSQISLSIYNSIGIEIKRYDGKELQGIRTINFSTEHLPSGIYYCSLSYGFKKMNKSFVITK